VFIVWISTVWLDSVPKQEATSSHGWSTIEIVLIGMSQLWAWTTARQS